MLRVVRGDNGSVLADALADALAVPPGDPLAVEEIVVHSRGMERWLSQHLSRRLGVAVGGAGGDGVCANVAFPFPIEVVRRAIRAAGGPDLHASVWEPSRLVWPLITAVEEGLDGWAAPLTDRVAADPADRFDLLRGVADLFDRYAAHRPDLVLRWLAGEDVAADGSTLPSADVWQPQLLRHLRTQVGQPTLAESAVQTIGALTSRGVRSVGLPSRLSLFGFTALPAAHLAILVALAQVIDVTLYLLHPSPGLWARREAFEATLDAQGLPVLPLRADLALPPPRNRLLRSWGRDTAELQLVVATIAKHPPTVVAGASDGRAAGDGAAADSGPAPSLLRRLQATVREDQPIIAEGPAAHERDRSQAIADPSVQIHACHGRTRQVQVLRDEILRLLAADETLQPRDIVVMCPDVEAFAPLVTAHLAVPPDDPEGRPDLRVRLADRALRQLNPMLRVIDDVLGLAADRLTATRLLDLAGADPVRRRFGLADDDLDRLKGWVERSGMRWGLDVEDRRRDGVSHHTGTIAAGLDRMLLGAAVADEDLRTIGSVTPLDDIEGGDVALVGRLAELVDRLQQVLASFRRRQPLRMWVDALTTAADLLLRAPADDPWQRTQLTTLLDGIAAEAHDSPVDIELSEVRALLGDRLQGEPSWANHRTGDMTVCTLVPMRSVPHRVVCLLGMDDEVFPRRRHPRGDDLIARHPRVGDRDTRTEDRQLLLDAVMAASDAVVITYSGIDERTGEPRPPCVPVAEFARAIDALAPGTAAAVTTSHPLHPHDPAAFRGPRPGFDRQAHAAAVRSGPQVARQRPGSIAGVTLPSTVDVDRLIAFTRDPAGYFYRHTVGAYVPEDPEQGPTRVPLTIDGLAQWSLGEELLRDAAAHDPDAVDRVVAVMRGRGLLPPPPFGDKQLRKVTAGASDILDLCARLDLPTTAGTRCEVDASVGQRQVVGSVAGLHGTRHVSLSYSKLRAKAIIATWVRLLALTAQDPGTPWEAFAVGRHERTKIEGRNAPHAVHFAPLGPTPEARARTAEGLLGDLLDLHDDGLREPLVVPPLTAAAYAIARVLRQLPTDAADDLAAERWEHDDFGFDNEADMPAHLLLLGDSVPYEVLRRQPARPQDQRLGNDPEPHCFGGLAVRLWAPVLTRCKAAS